MGGEGKRLCGTFDCWAEWNGGEIRYYPVRKVIYGVVRISSAIVVFEIETIHKIHSTMQKLNYIILKVL